MIIRPCGHMTVCVRGVMYSPRWLVLIVLLWREVTQGHAALRCRTGDLLACFRKSTLCCPCVSMRLKTSLVFFGMLQDVIQIVLCVCVWGAGRSGLETHGVLLQRGPVL